MIVNIKNDELDIEIIENNTSKKININKDILHNLGINKNFFDIGTFESYYSYIFNELKQSREVSSRIVLCSKLCFSHRIPPFEIKTNNNINMTNDLGNIKDICIKLLQSDTITTYHCENTQDLLSACIYHFTCNGYLIKQCPICKSFFLEKKKKVLFCSDICKRKNATNKEMERRKNDPKVAIDKKIRDMLSSRDGNEINQYMIEYQKAKDTMNDKQLLNWLNSQHINYLKKNKGGCK